MEQDNEQEKRGETEEYKPATYSGAIPSGDIYDELLEEYKPDPEKEKEAERKRALGKAYWAGSLMFGNAIANLLNYHATSGGAPALKYEVPYDKMYEAWRNDDADARRRKEKNEDYYKALRLKSKELAFNTDRANEERVYNEWKTGEQNRRSEFNADKAWNRNYNLHKEDQTFTEKQRTANQDFQEKEKAKDRQNALNLQDSRDKAAIDEIEAKAKHDKRDNRYSSMLEQYLKTVKGDSLRHLTPEEILGCIERFNKWYKNTYSSQGNDAGNGMQGDSPFSKPNSGYNGNSSGGNNSGDFKLNK